MLPAINGETMHDPFPKRPEYYENARSDILQLLPAESHKVLEIGCGTGNTLVKLRNLGRARWVGGIELNGIAAEKARKHINRIWVGDVNDWLDAKNGPAEESPFDVILCLDVLEHLVDPWTLTVRLANILKPGGSIIAVLPNIRFYKVVLKLLFEGQWEYEESGVLDSTHLRFFTRSTMIAMFEQAGLQVKVATPVANMKPWRNKWILNKLTGGQLLDIYAYSYRLRAEKVDY